jgi:predicted  nucleic acid-binding Zn-ribbon protein
LVIQQDTVNSSTLDTASKIEEQHELTRRDIVDALEREHETIKGDVAELRRSLHQLHAEMERRAKELKSIILQIDRTRKDKERRSLQKKGNSISVILMSLHTLYQELQV